MSGGGIRPDWRNIPVVDLTDDEVALLTDQEFRWVLDLLIERRQRAEMPASVAATPLPVDPADERFDELGIALMGSGERIWIYPGEHEVEGAFAGEKLGPLTDKEIRSNSYVSCFWDRSKVVGFEPLPAAKAEAA